MSQSAHPLDKVSITSPCNADWDSMVGNDVVRFCRHCNLNVHDLSLMTREEALALVRRSQGRLCLRFRRRADGTIETAPPFQKLHLIKRRASRIVAGAFGATLSLCASVAAQQSAPATDAPEAEVCERPLQEAASYTEDEGGSAALTGTLTDFNESVVPGVAVTLKNDATGNVMKTQTNEEGQYRFQFLAGGTYTLVIEATGFSTRTMTGLHVTPAVEQKLNFTLQIAGTTGGGMLVESKEPLIRAVMAGDAAEVSALIKAGADVNVLDDEYGSTPLMEAVALGNKETLAILLEAGANVNLKTPSGRSAMTSLTEETTGEILRALISAGAELNVTNSDGDTPLIVAAQLEKSELVRALIKAGAKLNVRNEAGQTALMLAAREGHVKNVRALLKAGADTTLEDEDGWTALKYAEDNEHKEIEELLRVYPSN